MKLYLFLIIIAAATSSNSFGQQNDHSVISAGGDISKSSTIILEWTLGELAVETAVGSDRMYTQGFHQPLLITKLKPATALPSGYTVTVYPNPVVSILNINIQSAVDSKVYLKLLDAKGNTVYNNSTYSKGSSIKINMQILASGIYLLTVTNPSGITIGTYKIVKAS